jgi:hypothetical protein
VPIEALGTLVGWLLLLYVPTTDLSDLAGKQKQKQKHWKAKKKKQSTIVLLEEFRAAATVVGGSACRWPCM